jgi:branched-chain amino acid transport system permease protein
MAELLQQVVNGLTIGGVYALIALGLTTVFGILGIAHFAHGSISMFGGYLSYVLVSAYGMGLWLAAAISLVAGLLIGVVVERLAYRPVRDANHVNAFIVALGLTMIAEGINLRLFGADQVVLPTKANRVIHLGPITLTELRLYVIASTVALIAAMTWYIGKTKTGAAIRAVAQNRQAAILMGVNIERITMTVFAISSALGMAAGIMVAALFAVAPGVGEGLAIKGFAVLILGGLGSVPGAILGGFTLGVTEALAAGFISSSYKDVIAFLMMIGVLLLRPEGLLGKAR